MRLANGTLPWPWVDPDKALPWVEKRIGFALADSQIAATRLALMCADPCGVVLSR
jgi:exodeoxyribonuclease V alpha subunit